MMAARIVALVALLLAGCVSTGGTRGSRLWPWNWGSSDSSAKVAKAEARGAAADEVILAQAQRNAHATQQAIKEEKQRQLAAGGVSRELETAGEYAMRTVQSIDAVQGFMAFDVQREIAEMVRLRNSQVIAERERGDKLFAAADKIAEKAAEVKIRAERELAAANAKVKGEHQRALVAEEKYHKIWFWIWIAVAVYVIIQLLPLIAQVIPAFGPISKAVSWVAAPAVQAGYSRLRRATGKALHAIEATSSGAAEAARAQLDGPISEHDQKEILHHYQEASHKNP